MIDPTINDWVVLYCSQKTISSKSQGYLLNTDSNQEAEELVKKLNNDAIAHTAIKKHYYKPQKDLDALKQLTSHWTNEPDKRVCAHCLCEVSRSAYSEHWQRMGMKC